MSIQPSGFIDTLPIFSFKDAITESVDHNQVTIITAETGAGKSTQVPQYLAEHGYTKVIITQPRILAARNLSHRVREEWAIRTGRDSDEIIGYRTAHERDDTPNTKILYCTDGLQLVREITGAGISDHQVLVLDEVHEWNENMEVLVAWAKKRCEENPHFKVIIMSATIETNSLATYFGTTSVITVPGRSFGVTKRRGTNIISELVSIITNPETYNTLVFLPGKSEIQDTIEALQKTALDAGIPLLPLHSQLEPEIQQRAFANYPNGKIVLSTNIAQTSVTIDDIDIVIDSGLERRSEVRSGVEGLFISQISQADCLQRAGRAGRTKPGEYILAPYDTMPCLEFDERPKYGTPEIMRKHIDRLTLRLANIDIDIGALDFYHDPSRKAIAHAKRTLIALGALTKTNEVTGIGRKMERFPVESSYGRMLVESQKYSKEIQTKLAAIIAIQEIGGIVKGGPRYTGWRKFTKSTKSDLIAQFELYLSLPSIYVADYDELGIIGKNIDKAQDVMDRLNTDLGLDRELLGPVEQDEQDPLLQSIVSGQIDQLWSVSEEGDAVHIASKQHRELSSSTVVRNPKLVTGTPFDLQIPTRSGTLETLHLLQGLTIVNTEWLINLAPQLFTMRRSNKTYYDTRIGGLAKKQVVSFGKQLIEGSGTPITDNTPQHRRMFAEAYAEYVYTQIEKERRQLGAHHTKRIPAVSQRVILQQVKQIANGAISFDEMSPQQRANLANLARLHTHVGTQFMESLSKTYRAEPKYQQPRKKWKPQHKRKKDRYYSD